MQPWSQPLLWSHPSGAVVCDPYFGNVVLLMGFEGANGSTGAPGMTDESPAANGNATVIGGSVIDTSQFKFGTASLRVPTTSNSDIWFNTSPNWVLSTINFTIETWIRFNSLTAASHFIVAQWTSTAAAAGWSVSVDASGNLVWTVSTTGSNSFADITAAWSPALNTWYHVAVDFDGTKYRAYVNGVMIGSSTTLRTIADGGVHLSIGANGGGVAFFTDGWWDELRITKGVARYAIDSGPATWNPSDKSINIALSGNNLTATASATGDMAVRATYGHSTGKWYFEVTVGSTYAGGDTGPGIMTFAAARDTFGQNATGGVIVYPAGAIYYNGSPAGLNIGAQTAGNIIGVAVDLTNMKIWFRVQLGSWNGSGTDNPATNTGGISISTVFGSAAAYPVQAFGPSANGSASTVNFGATTFVNGPPSGFLAWSNPAFAVPTAAFPRVTCGIFQATSAVTTATVNNNNRIFIPAAYINHSATSFTLTLNGNSIGTTAIDDIWVGNAAAGQTQPGTNACNFDGTQVQVKFGGATSVTIPQNGQVTSDAVTYNVSNASPLVIAFHLSAGSQVAQMHQPNFGGSPTMYSYSRSANTTSEANLTTVTGTYNSSGTVFLVWSIQ
jgi:hypothetical protein